MRVRLGWSGETSEHAWQKVDVELEEADLSRILATAGLPGRVGSTLPAKICYQLLQNEAEVMLLSKLKTSGYPVDKADARIDQLQNSTAEIISKIQQETASND